MNHPPEGTQANILVVDDSPANLQLLRQALLEQNYKVRPVTEGALALQAAQTEAPDLILLDILMPEMDGWKAGCSSGRPNWPRKSSSVSSTSRKRTSCWRWCASRASSSAP